LLAALRILRDVVHYRIRKREMANLASSLTVMVVMRLGWQDIVMRFGFAMALNVLVYLLNDIFDVRADHASGTRDRDKIAFLQNNMKFGWAAASIPLGVMIGLGAMWNHELLWVLCVAGGSCLAYSARLKRLAFLDLATIFVCATAGSMLAFPLDRALGWCLAGLLGCFAMCFQVVQMVRDHDEDASFGTRTTAVVLGPQTMMRLQRVLLVLTAVYASLLVHRWVGVVLLLTVLLPFRAKEADRYWNHLRLTLGVAWLAIVVFIGWTGMSYGWLTRLGYESLLW